MTSLPGEGRPLDGIGVVFDVGDTLVEVMPVREAALGELGGDAAVVAEVIAEFDRRVDGLRFPNHLFGLPADVLEEILCGVFDVGPVAAKVMTGAYRESVRRLLGPRAEVVRGLRAVKGGGAVLGLLTNGTAVEMEDTARLIGALELCDVFASSQQLGDTKPSASVFRWMQDALGLPPERLVMVGDDVEHDVGGALGCGWRAVWIDGDADLAPRNSVALPRSGFPGIADVVIGLVGMGDGR